MRWKPTGKSKAVQPRQLHNFATKKFKDQSEVLTFAAQHPGAFSAAFLQQVHQKYTQLMLNNTRQLRQHSLVQWAATYGGATDKRDTREVATLRLAMDSINAGQLAAAMDVLSQRIVAIQLAKASGGSWEKAARVELTVPGGASTASAGLLRLTQ